MHEVSYQTEMGQLVDLITAPEDRVDLSKFNLSRTLVIYKTAIYLPVALALLICEFPLEKNLIPATISSRSTSSFPSASTSRSRTTTSTLPGHRNRLARLARAS